MVQPMNMVTSRSKKGVIMVAPAQSGKTQGLILNAAAYSIKVDPMDTIIYSPTQAAARDFSTRRIDRMHRMSEELGAMMLSSRDADNKFDKQYTSGMILTLSWPSVTELAGRPIPRVLITDFDRIEDDIGGDGNAYDLGSKRTTTFGSFAMTVAESSPSRPVKDPKWVRSSPHEAPPCEGILGLYNRGDKRRLYWQCPNCRSFFEGNFKMLTWDKLKNDLDAADTVRMICPHIDCKKAIYPDDRAQMLRTAVWLCDGQGVDEDGNILGDEPRSDIASYWLNGVAAAFQTWPELVLAFIRADRHYDKTGDEKPLTKFYNNDLAEPYIPKAMESLRLPEALQARAEDIGGGGFDPETGEELEKSVAEDVRFLVAQIDVGKNLFVVQVHGICPGDPFDMIVVDRFSIRLNEQGRLDTDGQVAWIRPGTYLDDWDLIESKVMAKSYPLADGSGRRMRIKYTVCDSGGEEGVTGMAYNFFRKMRTAGNAGRFMLIKGDPKPGAPMTRIVYPNSNDSKNKAAAQGDIPVMMFASNQIKDMLSNRLDCLIPGKGMLRFPKWLPDWFYAELCVEMRTDKGWMRPPHSRNEAWDLAYYCIGLCMSPLLGIIGIDWNNPPNWAAPWATNSLISAANQNERFAKPGEGSYDFAAMARKFA